MKILHVTPFFSPILGGSVEVPYRLSKELAKRGHEIAVYTSDFKLSQDYIDSISEVRVCYFKTWWSWANLYVTPGIVKEAKGGIRHFDVIHMHNYRTFQNVVVARYAREYGIPYVLQAHGSAATFSQKRWLKTTFDALWGYRVLKDAAKLIAFTKTESEQYKSMGVNEDKIEIVPNGIDLAEFENLPQKGEFRKKYGLNDNHKLILYLGRIHKTKGLDLLAKAFAELSKSLNNAKLVIVGPDDGYLPSLKKLIADLAINDKVLFTGPLYGQEKLKAYVDAHVHVLFRAWEPFGLTLLEAMACGTPVICSQGCGIAHVIDDQAGLVVPYDKEQLHQTLQHMLSDNKMRQRFGERGGLLVRDRFNWQEIAKQVERVYQKVLL